MPRPNPFLKWCVALCVLCGTAYGLVQWRESHSVEPSGADHERSKGASAEAEGTVELGPDAAKRLGIAVQSAREVSWSRTTTVWGRVVPNPRATSRVHAAAAGRVRSSDAQWPTLGQRLSSGQLLGYLEVRVGPDVRLELQNKLTEARLRLRGEEDVVKVHTRTVESLKKVTDREILARVELDVALVSLAEAKIQASVAEAAVALWEKSLRDLDAVSAEGGTLWSLPITAPQEGVVTELSTRPGTAVEPGSLLLQLVDFRRPLVRLDVPLEMVATNGASAEVVIQLPVARPQALRGVSGPTDNAIPHAGFPARLVGPAATVDASTQLIGIWYDVRLVEDDGEVPEGSSIVWRPGLQVQAELAWETSSEPAVAVPASAVLFHEGRSLVYVQTEDDRYERREVRLLQRDGHDWILAAARPTDAGISVGDAVVHRQAQVLLSREFLKSGGDPD